MDLSVLQLIYVLGIVVWAAMTQGMLGFGFGMLSIPMLSFLFSPQEIVPISNLICLGINGLVVWTYRKDVQLKRFGLLFVLGLLGLPLGHHLLSGLPIMAIKVMIGIVMLIAALLFAKGWHIPLKNEKVAVAIAGLLGGVAAGAFGMGGPPIVIFLTSFVPEKNVFKANIGVYFGLMCVVLWPFYIWQGAITLIPYTSIWVLTLVALVGTVFGIKISQYLPQSLFRKCLLAFVAFLGVLIVISTFVQ